MTNKKPKEISQIKSSFISRGFSLAKLTLGTTAGLAAHTVSNLLSDKESQDQNWKEFLKKQAGGISAELGVLKGSLMKAGQMLSMYGEHFLPPEANQLLKTLQSDSPAVSFKSIEETLRTQLSEELLSELEIDPQSIGTASIGQVHKARIKTTGEWIALKVQYPGVEKAIDSDLKAIKSFLSTLKLLPKNLNTDHLFSEVKEMLHQEVNYRLEAQHTKEYGEKLKGDSRYVVPKVYDRYCADKVIATSFELGISPDDILVKSLSLERRNRLSLSFLDLYFKEVFEWGYVQTDPHLGNYKVRLNQNGQDQLVVLDFGAVRKYSSEFLESYYQMILASVEMNSAKLHAAALKLKFISEEDDADLKQLFEDFCLTTIEPFLEPTDTRLPKNLMTPSGEYLWKKSDLPQRLTKKVFQMIQSHHLRPPPREVIFLDRKTGGVFIFLSVMGAEICARPLLLKYLSKL